VTLPDLDGLWWLLGCLIPFIFIQRWLHREVQAVFLILTRSAGAAVALFSILFFPGVFLHEFSHYLAAKLLRVGTGRFSVLPKVMADGKLRLGYVETDVADPVRASLIGLAPLITGGLAIAAIGTQAFGLGALGALAAQGGWDAFWRGLAALPNVQDFWVWFYLAFTISSTMLPSASDRQAWLPVVGFVVVVLLLAGLVGAGPWMLENLAPWFNRGLRALAVVFGISLVLHVALWLPVGLFRMLLSRITGLRVA
jgi:hypothetical protein